MAAAYGFGVHFEPTDHEIITFLLKRVTGFAGDDEFIKTDNLYGHREPWDIFGDFDHKTRRYFYSSLTRKTAGGHRFSRNVGKGTWTNKGKATPILSVDRRVIIGYRRTFRYQTKASNLDKKGSWLMTEYVLPDAAIKFEGIKEEYKNFALCVLKKKKTKNVKPHVGSGLGDFGAECSCSCSVEAPITDFRDQTSQSDNVDFGYVGPKEVQTDEDWIHELEESIMDDHRDDVINGLEEGDSNPGGTFPLVDDDDDWIHELEESMMDHDDNCYESGLVSKMDGIGEPLCEDDPSFEKELLELFDFDLPADDHFLWDDNLLYNGRFLRQDQSSAAPLIAGS
ncbi:NAC domain-containing protein 78 [Striga hermonthica]|uniref:NAC domain-containing protein 78 n=1 Tax=Striga hermonthica TaxID=68872 RepID=A0A9N7NLB0_STRHE|nr:NAC domain-containing protein 78 [Striga hermonthica]